MLSTLSTRPLQTRYATRGSGLTVVEHNLMSYGIRVGEYCCRSIFCASDLRRWKRGRCGRPARTPPVPLRCAARERTKQGSSAASNERVNQYTDTGIWKPYASSSSSFPPPLPVSPVACGSLRSICSPAAAYLSPFVNAPAPRPLFPLMESSHPRSLALALLRVPTGPTHDNL